MTYLYKVFYKKAHHLPNKKTCHHERIKAGNFQEVLKKAQEIADKDNLRVVMIAEEALLLKNEK